MTGFLDLSTSMTLNDLEPFPKGFLVNFSQFLDAAHISILNCDEMAGVRPTINLRMKVSALNVDFSSLSPIPYVHGARSSTLIRTKFLSRLCPALAGSHKMTCL